MTPVLTLKLVLQQGLLLLPTAIQALSPVPTLALAQTTTAPQLSEMAPLHVQPSALSPWVQGWQLAGAQSTALPWPVLALPHFLALPPFPSLPFLLALPLFLALPCFLVLRHFLALPHFETLPFLPVLSPSLAARLA